MPNWCSNKITIVGGKDNIKSIITKIREIPTGDKYTLFETLIGKDPQPSIESNLKRYGTKWDVSVEDCNGEFNDDMIILYPNTAWAPPVPFCVTLAKEYGVNVEIQYSEPGNDFCGINRINSKGEIILEEDYDYNEGMFHLDNEQFWNDQENSMITDETLNGKSLREYINENYSYVDEAGQIRLAEILTKVLVDNSGD